MSQQVEPGDPVKELPPSLGWLQNEAGGPEWLESLPRLVAECAEEWRLRLGEPFPGGYVSLPVAATLPDGADVVLKVQFPHRESEHEAAALALWDGDGAVRLVAHDPQRHALLLERCLPGTKLSALEEDAVLDVFVDLLPRLLKPAERPFRRLAEEAAWWAGDLEGKWERAGRPFERSLLDDALDALRALPASQSENVLLHQDLHPDNVLRAEREPWLVIDPKPLVGERAFAVAPIVRAFELGQERRQVIRRLDRLTEALDLDRERACLWCLAQTVAWSFGSDHFERHVETARWLREAIRA
jgi:streptomycin 6-kinase